MDADTSMKLVVETDFMVGFVLISGELDTVHTEVAMREFGKLIWRKRGGAAKNLRQGDKGSAVVRPGYEFG